MVWNSSRWLVLMIFVVLTLPVAAKAEPEDESRKHFVQGLELADEQQYAEAAIEFQRSYEIRPHFGVLYNLGLAYLKSKPPKIAKGVTALQRYLDEGGKEIPPNQRAEVEQELAHQKARIATLDLRGIPADAVVQVGDEVMVAPLPGPVQVGIGTHRIVITAPNRKPIDLTISVGGGDYRVIDFSHPENAALPEHEPVVSLERARPGDTVAAIPGAPTSAIPAAPSSGPAVPQIAAVGSSAQATQGPSHRNTWRVAGILSAGIGGAGLATGTVLGLIAHSRNQSALNRCPKAPCSDDATALESQSKNYATGANIAFVAGGALVLSGVLLYLLAPTEKPTAQTQARLLLSVEPTSLGLVTRGTW